MERSNSLIKAATFLMAVALLCYLGYAVYDSETDPFRTAPVVHYEMHDNLYTSGYSVFSEDTLSGTSGIFVVASEGEKLSAGQPVARKYSSRGALQEADRLREIKLELDQLESLSINNVDKNARESVYKLSSTVSNGDFSELDAIALDIETYIFSAKDSYTREELMEKMARLKSEQQELQERLVGDTVEITTDTAGFFSYAVDGYEGISPKDLENITVKKYEVLFSQERAAKGNVFGKLVNGAEWYYVTEINAESAAKISNAFKGNSKVTIKFSKTYTNEVEMQLEYLSSEDNGKCIAVFSCRKYIQDVASIRRLEGEIIFGTTEGLRVPIEAVHLDEDGNEFVYMLSGLQAKKTKVSVIAEDENYYVVSSGDGVLREGAQVITRANDLYDGKVVT